MRLLVLILTITTLSMSGCFSNGDKTASIERAIAVLSATEGSAVSGQVTFEQQGDNVLVIADVYGLAPNSRHGFHVHEFGDISSKDGTSAGGHYNPEGHPHNIPPAKPRHAGAFGNIQSDINGYAHFEFIDDTISVFSDHNPVVGRSVVIHEKEDTGEQPVGNAGARIAVGVIGIAK